MRTGGDGAECTLREEQDLAYFTSLAYDRERNQNRQHANPEDLAASARAATTALQPSAAHGERQLNQEEATASTRAGKAAIARFAAANAPDSFQAHGGHQLEENELPPPPLLSRFPPTSPSITSPPRTSFSVLSPPATSPISVAEAASIADAIAAVEAAQAAEAVDAAQIAAVEAAQAAEAVDAAQIAAVEAAQAAEAASLADAIAAVEAAQVAEAVDAAQAAEDTAQLENVPEYHECPICCESINPDMAVMRCRSTPIGHYFHAECMERWITVSRTNSPHSSPSCPMCRNNIEIHQHRLHDLLDSSVTHPQNTSGGADAATNGTLLNDQERNFFEAIATSLSSASCTHGNGSSHDWAAVTWENVTWEDVKKAAYAGSLITCFGAGFYGAFSGDGDTESGEGSNGSRTARQRPIMNSTARTGLEILRLQMEMMPQAQRHVWALGLGIITGTLCREIRSWQQQA